MLIRLLCLISIFLIGCDLNNKSNGEGISCIGSDYGCLHRDRCSVPCADCCGPNGMLDCFKNPDPR